MTEWLNLSRRQAGLPPETELVEGVPSHLFTPLKGWVRKNLLEVEDSYWDRAQLQSGTNRYEDVGEHLLTVVDFVLYWYPRAQPADFQTWVRGVDWRERIAELDEILTLGRSIWRVNASRDGLERRTEETVTSTARQAMVSAPEISRGHLQAAWAAVYGRSTNPDLAYTEAMRAIEEIACPLVEPKRAIKGQSTLGTVIGELKSSPHKWELALPDKNGAPVGVAPLIVMLELLWHSHVSRHGGAPKSRRQDDSEAQAAVQLTVTIVQWLSTGVLRRRASA